MPRLFVALETPRALADSLLATLPRERGIRPTPAAQVHLTLRFVGEVDEDQAAAIDDVLATIAAVAVPVQVAGAGRFGRRGGILWAGVAPAEPLLALHGAIDLALRDAGIEPEARPFHPHLTLARCAPHAPEPLLREWVAAQRELSCPPYLAQRFVLFESRLQRQGAEHRCRRGFALRPADPDNPT
ncbi:RNA 2',3'-cyclic phosphodiesterase [Cupriavidus gilardii]|uniref:RNA 2',3'-cyclic phosphodiesterase n=1 Tax=Cupriavidus gilardii TaxID=82541 RepID=UPI001EE57C1E|nr:RNA 2',3'-cyclic phosphodiesterase [Cupriavidus gilardii]MCG5261241.1 RNA 2',3'-cyclic phosphodiesterase [Cupriavidus gilardii]MDF9428512.1 RNA 2',3'-cyclic phosphodiesterase [Cupriavidus gilardii]